jgi:tetratricopeptide (TPR) repeat protein
MSYRQLLCLVLIGLVVGNISCRNFLDVQVSGSKIEATKVYKDNTTATNTLLGIYGGMHNGDASPARLARSTGLSGDELALTWTSNMEAIYKNMLSPNNVIGTNLWTAGYYYIRVANDVYWGCYNSETLDPAIRKQLMAEALFVRTYWFFYLTNLYGDIPIPLTTDVNETALLGRTSQRTVYQQIIADLLLAQKDIDEQYKGVNSKDNSDERVRPNRATVSALLARVYLYTGKYTEAEQQASAIIAMSETYALVALDQVFLKNSKEAIWQLMPGTPNTAMINTTEGNEFILTQSPKTEAQQVISSSLLDAFEAGDQRRKHWIGTYTDRSVSPAVTYYYPYKYKVKSGEDIKEYSMIFRLAEIYLIRAECEVHLGQLPDALADLNKIRQRAGLAAMPVGTLDKDQLLNAIFRERQVELFTEQCHRWFDLKRTGKVDVVMATETPAKGGDAWNTTKQLWPIPSVEISRAPNVVQNPGY